MLLIGLAAPLLDTDRSRGDQPGVAQPARPARADDRATTTARRAPSRYWMGTDCSAATSTAAWSTARACRCIVGVAVAVDQRRASASLIGLVAGYIRWLDAIVMRVMDGLMAIPAILLAIALVSLSAAGSLQRDRRDRRAGDPARRAPRALGRAVDARGALRRGRDRAGTPTPLLLVRHILPNTIAPLIVQATFICAIAILIEAILSFLGVGIPPRDADLGQHHGGRPRAVPHLPAQHLVPRHLPRADGARRQHAGRRAARHARPEACARRV